jgi:hypothetical protein
LPFENKLTLSVNFNKKTVRLRANLIQAAIFMFLSQRMYVSEEEIIQSLMVEKNLLQSTM